MWHVAGFNPRTSGAFRRVGWAPWLSEDRELPYLYENTSTNRVAVFRENMYDSMGRRSHWCVWDGDNRSRLAAVRADKRARRVDFFAGIQTSLIAEAATVDGVENRGFVLEKVSTLETEIFGRRRRRPHCCRRARRLGSYCSCPFAGSRAPGAWCHSGDQLSWAACRPCRACRSSFSASLRRASGFECGVKTSIGAPAYAIAALRELNCNKLVSYKPLDVLSSFDSGFWGHAAHSGIR